MKTLKKIAVLPLFISATFAASANQQINYDYIEIGSTSYPDYYEGIAASASVSLADNWYAKLSTARDSNADVENTVINIGFNSSLSDKVDFVAELGYEDFQFDSDNDDSGYNVLVGLRSMASESLEFGLYTSYSDVIEATDILIETRYHFSEHVSLAIEVGNDSVITEHYGLNLRYSF